MTQAQLEAVRAMMAMVAANMQEEGTEKMRSALLPIVDRLSAICHGDTDDTGGLPRSMARMARMAMRAADDLCAGTPDDDAHRRVMREQATLVYLHAAAQCAAVAAREVGGVEPAVMMLAGASATTALLRKDAEPYKQVAMLVSQVLVEAYKGDAPLSPEAMATALGHGIALAVSIVGGVGAPTAQAIHAMTPDAGRARLAELLRTLVGGAQAVLAANIEATAEAQREAVTEEVRRDN